MFRGKCTETVEKGLGKERKGKWKGRVEDRGIADGVKGGEQRQEGRMGNGRRQRIYEREEQK